MEELESCWGLHQEETSLDPGSRAAEERVRTPAPGGAGLQAALHRAGILQRGMGSVLFGVFFFPIFLTAALELFAMVGLWSHVHSAHRERTQGGGRPTLVWSAGGEVQRFDSGAKGVCGQVGASHSAGDLKNHPGPLQGLSPALGL